VCLRNCLMDAARRQCLRAPSAECWKGKGTFTTLDASGKPGKPLCGKPLPISLKHSEVTIPLLPKNASGYYEVIRR
jgi:hypothetical protein